MTRRRNILKWFTIVFGAVVLVLAGLLIVFRIALSHAPEYRAQVQAWVSERTGLDIQFASMDARWRWYGPELYFDNAVVASRDGKRKLVSARRVSLGYDVWTALSTLRLAAGRLTLEAPQLQVIRTTEGKFEIVGQTDLPDRDPNSRFEPDDMPTGRLSVVDAQVSFRDLMNGRGPWVVPNVHFDLKRSGRSMTLEGEARLPEKLGTSLHFAADTEGRLAETADLRWHFRVQARDLNLAGWPELSPDRWVLVRAGQGSFDLEGIFSGASVLEFKGDVRFDNLGLLAPAW